MELYVYESGKTYSLDGDIKITKDPVVGPIVHGEFGVIPASIIYPKRDIRRCSDDIECRIDGYIDVLRVLRIKHRRGTDLKMDFLEIRNIYRGARFSSYDLSILREFFRRLHDCHDPRFCCGFFIPGIKDEFLELRRENMIWDIYSVGGLLDWSADKIRNIFGLTFLAIDNVDPAMYGLMIFIDPANPQSFILRIGFPALWRTFSNCGSSHEYAWVNIIGDFSWSDIVNFVKNKVPFGKLYVEKAQNPLQLFALYLNPHTMDTLVGIIRAYNRKYYNELRDLKTRLLSDINKLRKKYAVIYISNPFIKCEEILKNAIEELKDSILKFDSRLRVDIENLN